MCAVGRRLVEGRVEGVVNDTPEGSNGVGYAPVCHVPNGRCTTAQLPSTEKNLISHRGQAARAAAAILKEGATGP